MNSYLNRIGVLPDEVQADLKTLRRLQHQHLLSVPFENLDIHWGRRIVLDTGAFYTKIVTGRRGGFCYELNGLFNDLLSYLGFESRLISARVYCDDGTLGPDFDHAAIIVTLDGIKYLVDVGFGDFASEPLSIGAGEPQDVQGQNFNIENVDGHTFKVSKGDEGRWVGQYTFKGAARELAEFGKMCDFQQDSPLSHFRQKKVCSILTENGRKTLTDNKFIVTAGGRKTELPFESEVNFYEILRDEFNITRELTVI